MSRRSNALEKYPKVDPVIAHGLFDRDPSRGAYGEWMVGRVADGEHHETVHDVVVLFHQCKQRLPKEWRDLYNYPHTHALRTAIEKIGETSKRAKRRKHRGYTLIHEYPLVSFYRVDSYQGIKSLGRDTKWCITNESQYKQYKERLIVVAVSRLRGKQDAYSKFAVLSQKKVLIDPDRFLSWEKLKGIARDGYKFDWGVWDAKDRHPYHYGDEDGQPLGEMLDMLAGRRGATQAAMAAAAGGTEHMEIFKSTLEEVRGCRGAFSALEIAEKAAKHRLFNPLSLLDHPDVRSTGACRDVWKLSRKSHREALDREALMQLARRPAMNVPEVLELYLERAYGRNSSDLVLPLLDNGRLTAETKERVLHYVRTKIYRLPPVG
jgi:hypothetical protein